MAMFCFFPGLRQETGSGLSRGDVSPQRSTLSVTALLSHHHPQAIQTYQRSEVASHSIHTNKNSTGIRERNFQQPVIDTTKVHESSSWKVPYQHFVVTRPQSARSAALFYWTTQEKQLRFMSHVAVCTAFLAKGEL